jgi:hypothetical protein
MIDLLLWVTMTSYWMALILGTLGMLSVRMVAAKMAKLPLGKLLLVVFTPLSIAYYLQFPEDRPLRKIHRILSILVFSLTMLASVWILYTRYY